VITAPASVSGNRLARLEHAGRYYLTALSVLFLAAYATPILWPDLDTGWRQLCRTANLVIWALFAGDYLIRLTVAPRRLQFVRSHWFDLMVLTLPVVRPLRALRLIFALKILHQRTERWTRGRLAVYVAATTLLLVAVAALAVLDAERGQPDSTIHSYPDALWWAVVTITTVGYGDFSPATTEGRLVAVAMMIGGIGLLGFVTGSVTSWIVDRIAAGDKATQATRQDVVSLLEEIRRLRSEVADLRASVHVDQFRDGDRAATDNDVTANSTERDGTSRPTGS
jgi:voltage-gated potassium channel